MKADSNKNPKKNVQNTKNGFDEFRNLIKHYDITLIAYVLKRLTDVEHALSCAEINEHLNILFPSSSNSGFFFDARTTKRKLDIIDALDNSQDFFASLNQVFVTTYGGVIKHREADGLYKKSYPHKQGTQKRYYFEPLLESSDVELIYGSLNSSRYLSDAEKEYLLARLKILHPTYNMREDKKDFERNCGIESIEKLPDRPNSPCQTNSLSPLLPGVSSNLLKNVQIIHTAIEEEVQIEILYGIYDIAEETGKINFHVRNKNNKPYVLNPYALFWNDGEYYLIAQNQNYPYPTHYRVDRIIEVKFHKEISPDGYLENVKRRRIPDILRDYYERTKTGKVYFNGIRYANTHPGMTLYKGNKLITCTFECTNWSLQMLIDSFGSNISIQKSPLKHDSSEVDYNGNPQEFLLATVRKVQFDNAKRFAISNCQNLTVLGPDDLVKEVKDALQEALTKLK
ncbi:MAG: WYL domain-containing protein [Lachnospiraceae bacterium]|nr:WYL domain-containing protein [Lachnospiraceae bacterium]